MHHTHAYRFDMYDTICGCREAMDPEYRGNVCALTTRVNGRLKGRDACMGHVLTLDRGGHPLPFFWELFSSRFPSNEAPLDFSGTRWWRNLPKGSGLKNNELKLRLSCGSIWNNWNDSLDIYILIYISN